MMLELREFLNEAESSLASIANELGWTSKDVMKGPDFVACPHNPAHVIPATSFETHVEKCKLLSAGVSKDELEAIPPSSHFCYEGVSAKYHVAINLDDNNLSEILTKHHSAGHGSLRVKKALPLTNDRAVSELTQNERLAIYEHCIGEAKRQHQLTSIPKEELLLLDPGDGDRKDGTEKSQLEKLAELRDYKRRRQTYRAKNVHTTKKSYTEIIRDVILNQMSMLTSSAPVSGKGGDSVRAGTAAASKGQADLSAESTAAANGRSDTSKLIDSDVTYHPVLSANDTRPTKHTAAEYDVESSRGTAAALPKQATVDDGSYADVHDAADIPSTSRGHKRHKRRSSAGSSRSRSRTRSRSKSHKKHKHKRKKARRSSRDEAAGSVEARQT